MFSKNVRIKKVTMKFNFKSIFSTKKELNDYRVDNDAEYDKYVDFYYTSLINSIVLFSLSLTQLEELIEPTFDPLFELESEIDYAFTPVIFETVFRNNKIDTSLKQELQDFKKQVDDIPAELWEWELLSSHQVWSDIRKKVWLLLDKLGVVNRKYNTEYLTIYDTEGSVVQKKEK